MNSPDHLLGLINLIHGVVWQADPVTRRNTFASAQLTSLLGYTFEQWTSVPEFWEARVHPDDLPRVQAETEEYFSRGAPYEIEYRFRTASGRWIWLRDYTTPIFEGGRITNLGGVMLDITEQKNRDALLQVTLDRFAKVFAASPVGIVLTGLHSGRVMESNDAFLNMLGVTREILIGSDNSTVNPWVSLDDRAEMVRQMERGPLRDFETQQYHLPTMTVRSLLVSTEMLELEGEELILLVAQDITDRRAAQAAQASSENRFRALIQHSSDIVTVGNRGGYVVYTTPSMQTILGRDPEQLIGKYIMEFMHPEEHEEIRRVYAEVLEGGAGTIRTSTNRFLHQNGHYVWMEWVATNQVANPHVRGVVMNARDVTERVNSEEALQVSQSRLLSSEKLASLGRLTAGLAHEINTPLASAMNSLREARDLAQEYRDSVDVPTVTPDDHREIAGDLLRSISDGEASAARIGEFIRNMRSHTRDTVSGIQDFDAVRLAGDTLAMLAHQARGAQIALLLDQPKAPVILRGEGGRFRQVVTNLVVNALHACEERGRPGGSVTVSFEAVGDQVLMRIADTGTGIPAEVLPNIFDPMFTTKEVGKGTGLGLSIIYDIVTGHFKGEIHVETQEGVGTTFIVHFPLATVP